MDPKDRVETVAKTKYVTALAGLGVPCLGIDVLPAAVKLARRRGADVIPGSIFDRLPPGRWGSALLLDGNIGIGADPPALLGRLSQLLQPGGRVLVELDDREPGIRTHEFELRVDRHARRPGARRRDIRVPGQGETQ